MNLKDLRRRRKEIEEAVDAVYSQYTGGWNGYQQAKYLDRLIECFSIKEYTLPSKLKTETAFNKIYGFQRQKKELTQFIQA